MRVEIKCTDLQADIFPDGHVHYHGPLDDCSEGAVAHLSQDVGESHWAFRVRALEASLRKGQS